MTRVETAVDVATKPTLQVKCAGFGANTSVILDDVDISHRLKRVQMDVGVNGVPTAELTMVATKGLDVTLSPKVTVVVEVAAGEPGCIIETTEPDGSKRYRWLDD